MPEKRIRKHINALLEINKTDKILDFGCGTGNALRLARACCEEVQLYGIDADPYILNIAEQKNLNNNIEFKYLSSPELPFENNYFDKAMSTWVFHHLFLAEKIHYLTEVKRIIKPHGVFILADWDKPANFLSHFLFTIVRLIDNFETFEIHKKGQLKNLVESVGFTEIARPIFINTLFGTLSIRKFQVS